MNEEETKFTEADLVIFPPGTGYFVLVTCLLMISHAATFLVCHFLLRLPAGLMVILMMATVIFLVIFNIMIVRGYPIGAKYLSYLAILYAGIGAWGATGLLGLKPNTWAALIPTALSITSMIIMRGKKYTALIQFMEKRWSFYRRTGRTVLEEYYLQQKRK